MPKFVGCIGHESPPTVGRPFEATKHHVHGRGQPTDLVGRGGLVDPSVEHTLADARDLGANLLLHVPHYQVELRAAFGGDRLEVKGYE